MDFEFWGIVVAAAVSLFTSVLSLLRQLRRDKPEGEKTRAETSGEQAEAAAAITETAMALIDPLKKQITQLEQDVAKREEQISELQIVVLDLSKDLDRYGNALRSRDEHVKLLESGIRVLVEQMRINNIAPAFVVPDPFDFSDIGDSNAC